MDVPTMNTASFDASRTAASAMNYSGPANQQVCKDSAVYPQLLPLAGASILELGCGRAELTRTIAREYPDARVTALEVDTIQHALNVRDNDLPNVSFAEGGAQDIPVPTSSVDVVLMFKSLHHVPTELLGQALREIHRVLVPGGLAYISEPVFAGAYNEIMRVFHDEEQVRHAAFDALREAVDSGLFTLVTERFFRSPLKFASFAEFEARVLGVTHTIHRLTEAQHATVRARFASHVGQDGASFEQPMRIDVLRKAAP
jgi:ubiquinone/menaquinone biosynthesis C-methylase UbiE